MRVQRPWHAFYPEGVAPRGAYPDLPVWGLLERAAKATPDHTALVDGDERWSYRDLWGRVLEIAGWLAIDAGDRVVLRGKNSARFVMIPQRSSNDSSSVSSSKGNLVSDGSTMGRREVIMRAQVSGGSRPFT